MKKKKRKAKIPLLLALVYIALSIGVICGPTYYGLKSFRKWRVTREVDPSYTIKTIVQSTPGKVTIPSSQLGHIMGLTSKPQNLFTFDLRVAKKHLKAFPVINKVKLKKVKPSTIYVDYQLRQPFVRLLDYPNMAMDHEGFVFPIKPIFEGKALPEVVLGLPPFGTDEDSEKRKGAKWNVPLKDRYSRLALEMTRELMEYEKKGIFTLKKIDLSNAFSLSYGKREVHVTIEKEFSLGKETKCIFPKILRLSTKDFSKQLGDFSVLHEKMTSDYKKQLQSYAHQKGTIRFAPTTVDLRIPSIAFIDGQ